MVYGNHETIPTMAAAAAVTDRVRLTTAILISPFRGNGALLAKQLATVDSLSGGRLTVGIAVGGRPDDFTATATDFDGRGAMFDAQLAEVAEGDDHRRQGAGRSGGGERTFAAPSEHGAEGGGQQADPTQRWEGGGESSGGRLPVSDVGGGGPPSVTSITQVASAPPAANPNVTTAMSRAASRNVPAAAARPMVAVLTASPPARASP